MRTSPPKLLVHGPEKPTREYTIQQQETVIGRDPANQLALDDRKISRAHARILDREGRYTIRDLGSRNGTYVNDKRIGPEDGEVTIGDKDRIRVGNHIIQCSLPGSASSEEARPVRESEKTKIVADPSGHLLEPPDDLPDDGEDGAEWPPTPEKSAGDELETGVISQEEMAAHGVDPESVDLDVPPPALEAIRKGDEAPEDSEDDTEGGEPVAVEAEEKGSRSGDTSFLPQVSGDTNYDIMADLEELRLARARVIISKEEDVAEILPIERRRVTVGRGRQNDIVVSHHTVSSVHAEIQFDPEGFTLVDKNSTNGTYVDNGRIRSRRLRDGAYVMFGGVMGLFLHEIGMDKKALEQDQERLSDGLVRRGLVPAERAREALEEAKVKGVRLSEILLVEGDVSPAQWWETSRMSDAVTSRSNLALILVPILIILALVLAAVGFLFLF